MKRLLLALFLFFGSLQAKTCCHPFSCCTFLDNVWISADYLYWDLQDCRANKALVYEAPFGVVPIPTLGEEGTEEILNTDDIKLKHRSGGRFALGYWLENEPCFGWEMNYFFLPVKEKSRTVFSDGSIGSPYLRIPFFNVISFQKDSTGLATPGSFSGRATLEIGNQLQGAEWNFFANLPCYDYFDFSLLGGFRYLNFTEHLSFKTSSPYVNPPIDVFKTEDHFKTLNNYFGAQIGIDIAKSLGSFFIQAVGKTGLGIMCEKVTVRGRLLTNDYDGFTAVQKFSGGYFALPTNIGVKYNNQCSFVSEFDLNLGYLFFDCIALRIGYSGLYVNKLLRAARQIDTHINPTYSVTYADDPSLAPVGFKRPHKLAKAESLWAHGINAGVTFQF